MCRPANVFRETACPGGHIGPPLRGVGSVPEPMEIGVKRRLFQRGGTEHAPYQGDRSSAVYGGVRSPRPTEATQVVPSEGPI